MKKSLALTPTVEKREKEEPANLVTFSQAAALAIVCATCFCVVSIYAYHAFFSPRLATVDIQKYITDVRDALVAGEVDEKGAEEAIQTLSDTINALPSRYTVLSGDAVLGNAPQVLRIDLPELHPSGNKSDKGGKSR